MSEEVEQYAQRLILGLNRQRQHYVLAVDEKEDADKDAFYERGVAYGLSLALSEVNGYLRPKAGEEGGA